MEGNRIAKFVQADFRVSNVTDDRCRSGQGSRQKQQSTEQEANCCVCHLQMTQQELVLIINPTSMTADAHVKALHHLCHTTSPDACSIALACCSTARPLSRWLCLIVTKKASQSICRLKLRQCRIPRVPSTHSHNEITRYFGTRH